MKIAYDGADFHGLARQPGLRTVEGEVIHALTRTRAIRDARSSRFQSASRTDRGVSALGNVVAFDSRLAPGPTARAFNAKSERVWAWGSSAVPEDFNARRASQRWYRYTLPTRHSLETLRVALRGFEGEHNFRNFTRDRARSIARIDSVTATPEADAIVLDFRAPSFRWNLIRRIVAAALEYERGTCGLDDLTKAIEARVPMDFGLAPPQPLTLMDVTYAFPLEPVRDPTTLDRLRRLVEERTRSVEFAKALRIRFELP